MFGRSSESTFSSFHDHSHDGGDGHGRSKHTTVIIVAVVVTGVVVLALIVAVVFFLRRRNRRATSFRELRDIDVEQPSSTPVEPFVLGNRPISRPLSPIREKGVPLQHGYSDMYTWLRHHAPSGTSPPSSGAGTAASADIQGGTITQGDASAILQRLDAILHQGSTIPPATQRGEQDADVGTPPPVYQAETASS